MRNPAWLIYLIACGFAVGGMAQDSIPIVLTGVMLMLGAILVTLMDIADKLGSEE